MMQTIVQVRRTWLVAFVALVAFSGFIAGYVLASQPERMCTRPAAHTKVCVVADPDGGTHVEYPQ